ncbi:DNA mismatch repair protein MutS [Thermotoga sp. RQ7]|uniref:endonuclease MutS2 n=1 Tax=Thermotoga sp. RQ7 TaxID=126738 RepID=UPI0005A3271C|nr:endonuclease MutS2 [Thermotoga sp. RQ7]AJG41373.1 DNA mismatch repair protein MutS [Thermotoga sp. RQ7]
MDYLEVLDFPKVVGLVKRHTFSDLGKRHLDTLKPTVNPWNELELLEELLNYLTRWGEPPIKGLSDITPELEKLKAGSSLEPWELLRVSSFLEGCDILKNDLTRREYQKLKETFSQLVSFEEFVKEVNRCIEQDGEVSNRASPRLKEIRNEKRSLSSEIRKKADDFVKNHSQILQEQMYVYRDGRYLFPVKASMKRSVRGIVHHLSSSGATVFMEPEEFVELNNRMRLLEEEERLEISRILRHLTNMLLSNLKDLEKNIDLIAHYDSLYARAKFAKENNGIVVKPSSRIRLVNARHPLIPKDRVVPINLELPPNKKGVIITGPNMGGKTVTVKTVGLFTALMMSGFPLLCDEGTELKIFPKIMADIGEEQSIEQSLSTFSSHMKRIVEIVRNADSDSLVILDELGSGTDPVEGAALAIAIIEDLLEKGATLFVTTHLTPVKVFAMNHPLLLNASMEFDPETLSPTYRVLVGVPGGSHAFQIAEKLGLEKRIIENARSRLSQEEMELEGLIRSLHEKISLLEEEKRKLQKEKEEYMKLRAKYEEDYKKLRRMKIEEFDKELKELNDYIRKVKKELDQAIHVAKSGSVEEMRKTVKTLEKEREDLKKKAIEEEAEEEINVGDHVRMEGGTSVGKVVEVKGNTALVDFGFLRVKVPLGKLKKAKKKEEEDREKGTHFVSSFRTEIDIRGMTVEEAEPVVKKFIDDLVMNGIKKGYIIHGKGTGKLATGVWEILRKDRRVVSFRFGTPSEGGTGVTVVEVEV